MQRVCRVQARRAAAYPEALPAGLRAPAASSCDLTGPLPDAAARTGPRDGQAVRRGAIVPLAGARESWIEATDEAGAMPPELLAVSFTGPALPTVCCHHTGVASRGCSRGGEINAVRTHYRLEPRYRPGVRPSIRRTRLAGHCQLPQAGRVQGTAVARGRSCAAPDRGAGHRRRGQRRRTGCRLCRSAHRRAAE